MKKDLVYLVQTDTTVGFLSQDASRLLNIKGRPPSKPFLKVVASHKILKSFVRVPKMHRSLVRRAKKTTFAYSQEHAIRVVKEEPHREFVKKFEWLYSTSANKSGERFDYAFACSHADVIIEDERGFFEGRASPIIRLGKKRKMVLRKR